MLSEGVSPVLIENCSKDAGYPMGPLHLDSVNIDGSEIATNSTKMTMTLALAFGDAEDGGRTRSSRHEPKVKSTERAIIDPARGRFS